MQPLGSVERAELQSRAQQLREEYEKFKDKHLSLDMSRGKPCPKQLDLSNDLLTAVGPGQYLDDKGEDCRNYGLLSGIEDMKRVFSEMLDIPAKNIIVGGNSSLTLMFDTFARAYMKGLASSSKPWSQCGKIKILAPVPGYDRHFSVTEYFGAELINIPMDQNGPDMDLVEKLAREDESVKGILCVPVYSNPDGIVYSDETVRRLAAMDCAADDFTIIWDNAYCVHHLYPDYRPKLPSILEECKKYGHETRPLVFASTSKITMAGSGVACIAANDASIGNILDTLKISTISYDKMNQLRHARFLRGREGIEKLMAAHAEIIRPKFEMALGIFRRELGGLPGVHWTEPKGGYFISMYALPGTAKRVHQLCREAGVTLTAAGASFPYGVDPQDSNLRIAPTYPPLEELCLACELLCICIKLAAAEKALEA